ncbi:hypothetical protein [Paenibacillus qinlingensis]|uniref:Portal protein n=1 Tax=Paenibacillus qinlingensis TaxID=1837343 RepID=A0ABU1P6Q6_9BACL|nr:hypothetical protein [Paenibacillus qinlingensis]MDR6555445.1 hypothetical protein [Paenibacillus qinlingensis]
MADKSVDVIEEASEIKESGPYQTGDEWELAQRVQTLFRAAFDAKNQLGLVDLWRSCDDYKHNRQNPKQSEEHPGSVTNIIHPNIESQIADLVDKPYSVAVKGWEPSDDMFAEQTANLMDFIMFRNRMKQKLNLAEHDRLELGTAIIKVWFDDDELEGRGLPRFEPVSPANFFPDPKLPSGHLIQESEFLIHAVPKPLSWFRERFKERGKYVTREVEVPYNPEATFTDAMTDEVETVTSEKALLLECYMKDRDGKMYCVSVANSIVLEDSRKVLKGKKLQRRNHYPFVMIPCYPQRGTAWGMGDVELLMPTQDLINELDDQVRMNARMMGNPQVVIGMGAGRGFDFRKWTNKAGLRVPMRDQNAFKVVEGRQVSPDVINRREKAFQEADLISGRPDVNRGQQPGAVTAASAILALQQAGQKGVVHKAEMFKEGWSDVLELLFDEVLEHWDEEMWIRVDGDKPDWKFVNPKQLRAVPRMIPNALFGILPEQEAMVNLQDETGKEITRDAQFDLRLDMGNGFPNDKAFAFQMFLDISKISYPDGPLIGRDEMRDFLRNNVGIPLKENNSRGQQEMLQQQMMMGQPPPQPGMQPEMSAPPPMQPAMVDPMNQQVQAMSNMMPS